MVRAKKNQRVKMPSVLAFERKLEPSDALMLSGSWDAIDNPENWEPIPLIERRNRGVKSNFKPEVLKDEQVLQKEIQEPNPVWGDDASLPHHHDTLKLAFSLRVVGDVGLPSTCNDSVFLKNLETAVEDYQARNGLKILAKRYANNIANGRFLWRNRVGAEDVVVKATVLHNGKEQEVLTFPNYSLKDLERDDSNIGKLTNYIANGLSGQHFTLLNIEAYARLGSAQRIWPSQEMIMNTPKGQKSRHLFNLKGCAAIHSQKIGNALRTIDNWYADDAQPIAVEPFGSVTHQGDAKRKSQNDFYTLILKWVAKGETLSENEQHFVMAVLIRGGVFGESDK